MNSPITPASGNWSNEVSRLRQAGYSLPHNPTMARLEARKVADSVGRGSLTDIANRKMAADMNRSRLAATRGATGGSIRTASDLQMALPKIRQPLSSLMDKGIPFNVSDPKELIELRRWSRLFYSTHDLVPLLIDIYSTFPVQGLEFKSKDPLIERFYENMFMDELRYEEFLPQMLREYYVAGECTSLAHFSEELGIWSSEEILNPDMVAVSKSLFIEQERVQLLVKELVETLRSGPGGRPDTQERDSERLERSFEFAQLQRYYPEIIAAAARDDGLDISDALVSRMVNKASPWDLRGTPFLLRSFRTLLLEESLNAAQDAVCLVAGSPVLTSRGVKCIEDITTEDEVLTHRGRYRQVVRVMKREADEPGVTIRWWYDRPLTLTGEHPVYVRRPVNMPSHHYHGGRHTEWAEGFVPARDVHIYDQVLHPSSPDSGKEYVSIWEHLDPSDWVVYDPTDDAFGMTGHSWYDNAATQTKRVARKRVATVLSTCKAQSGDILRHNRFGAKTRHFAAEYKLTDDLLWFIGLHVADGSAQVRKHGTGSLVISLGTDEIELQQKTIRVIQKIFGIEPTVRPAWGGKKAVNITVNSLPLTMWFRQMCGVKETKRFPSWAFGLTAQQAAVLVGGWMDGDGCTDAVRTLGVSAYRHLQESAAWLIRRSGGITSVFAGQAETAKGWTGGSVTTVKTPRRVFPADQGGYWAEVRSVEHHQVTETVYNLEVEQDNSYCAPVAVHNCDRLYAPMVLATMGIENMGNDEPWIPSQAELDDLRDDMQSALAADFKLLVHNFGVQVTSVFGRESVPRFDTDYDRIDAKLMQAWGIGAALIMGGTGAGGTYASSAINREVCEQLMMGAQKKVIRHMRKRMAVIAEAQEHYDYDLKGGLRVPLYREIVDEDPDTGEKRIVRVPKLLIPDINFATLNLRDEAQERAFVMQLKTMGVPVADKTLAINLPLDAEQELEREALETKRKAMAKARVFKEIQDECDKEGLPYPPELAAHLEATLTLRELLAQTQVMEGQAMMASPEGQAIAALAAGGGMPPEQGGPPAGGPMGAGPEEGTPQSTPPTASGPSGAPLTDPTALSAGGAEPARNRSRPAESDEMRASSPKAASASQRWANRVARTQGPKKGTPRQPSKFERGPSSYGQSRIASEEQVEAAVKRREVISRHSTTPLVSQLVEDPEFFAMLHATGDAAAIRADWPEIRAGGAKESARLLHDLVAQYEEVTGNQPIFD